ncbi:DNA-directed RNA polymerase subunit K [Candidatus Woesearchaeota archaeon]|nr:MAG: DNA-directed RNA polymerase subunit K [Candidatus Woesearchaeota archaeon]
MRYTKYEKARMIGSRALQISMGAPFMVKLSEKELERIKYNPIEIAKIEFEKGVIPLTVRRPMPGKLLDKKE